MLVVCVGLLCSLFLSMQMSMTAQAGNTKNYVNDLNGGIASILDPGSRNSTEVINATVKELNLTFPAEEEISSGLVMANVRDAVNVRSDASEEASKVGKLYKDCGGTILERKDGWTKIQSGTLIGWAKDEYLLFGDDARALANDVGRMIAQINTETLRVRTEADQEAGVLGLLPKGDIADVVDNSNPEWVCIDYEGADGYVAAEYVTVDFQIDSGETLEEIKAREAAEREAKRHVNYGEYTTDADTTQLLAALGAAVIVIVLALLEPHLLLAKPRGNAVLVGEIFEVFTVPLAGVAAQNAEIAVDDGRQPQPVQHRRHPRADDNKDKRRNTQETAELVEPISARHKPLKPAFHVKTTFLRQSRIVFIVLLWHTNMGKS